MTFWSDIGAADIGLMTLAVIIGLVIGWLIRSRHAEQQKRHINSGWQEQLEAQRTEHKRLVEQNKALMQQVSRSKAADREASDRAQQLTQVSQSGEQERNALNRRLQQAETELQRLQSDEVRREDLLAELRDKLQRREDKVARQSRELERWAERLPPLVEKFRSQKDESERLQLALDEANSRLEGMEDMLGSEQTRVEPIDPGLLDDGFGASNDPDDGDDPHASERHDEQTAHNGAGDTAVTEPATERDDLQAIKGIGPAIEKTLNELGIFRYAEIADLTEYDINRVANHLKGFRSRIYREDWIGQARMLRDAP